MNTDDSRTTLEVTPTFADAAETIEGRRHLFEVLQDFDVLLVGLHGPTGGGQLPKLKVRPMTVAAVDEHCCISFLTKRSNHEFFEAQAPMPTYVTGQSRDRFVSLKGTIEITPNPERIRQLWRGAFDTWFEGPDDPEAVLVVFHPDEAELWDSKGRRGLNFLIESARALVNGEPPPQDEVHTHLSLH